VLEAIINNLGCDRVDTCLSGEEALALLRDNTRQGTCQYATVFTDLSMPFMNGFEFTTIARQQLQAVVSQPMFAAITGHTEFEYFSKALSAGID